MTSMANGGSAARRVAAAAGACGRWVVVLAALLAGASALGEVTLETDVSKVESTLDAGGGVKRELVPVEEVVPGEELRYTITVTNESEIPVGPNRIIITNPIPDGTLYVRGSAGGDAVLVEYSTDGETFGPSEPAGQAGPAGAGQDAAGLEASTDPAAGEAVRSLRWTYREELHPGDSADVFFHVRMR